MKKLWEDILPPDYAGEDTESQRSDTMLNETWLEPSLGAGVLAPESVLSVLCWQDSLASHQKPNFSFPAKPGGLPHHHGDRAPRHTPLGDLRSEKTPSVP